jgi:hypothetical protein
MPALSFLAAIFFGLHLLAISSASLGKAPEIEVTRKATTRWQGNRPPYGTIFV